MRTKQKKNTDIREGDDTDFADIAQYFHGGGVFSVAMCCHVRGNEGQAHSGDQGELQRDRDLGAGAVSRLQLDQHGP